MAPSAGSAKNKQRRGNLRNLQGSRKKSSDNTVKTEISSSFLNWITKYLRYTNYLGAAQLYLKENFLLEKPLKHEHIKSRVLGHWGTVPGLNLLYAHLNYLICKHKPSMFFVCGPGHGAPAVLANLFAEDTLSQFYGKPYARDGKGTGRLLKYFSWPGGFPSHTNPGTPGSILEGGELGYSLATAYGAVMDNPDLIAACVIGDGEAESGPLAGAWNSNKYLNPRTSGAVLPILHVNGYKITSPTIYASMSDEELTSLFKGFGYEPRIVDCRNLNAKAHQNLQESLEWAYQKIRDVQKTARSKASGKTSPRAKNKNTHWVPKWPMLVVRSLKGESGIEKLHGHKVEGSFHSHGIPSDPNKNQEDFLAVKKWLESYKVHELVDRQGKPKAEILKYVPKGNLRMGMNKHTNGGNLYKALKLPNPKKYEIPTARQVSPSAASNTTVSSAYMRDIFKLNRKTKNFRFMCPDETESNKYQSLFEVTQRAYLWPLQAHDENLSPDGRVMEVLSEHNLMGWLQGYLLTGRHGIFVTYEAFAMIVASMTDQYAKFIKQAMRTKWRKPVASLNVLLTSVGWRQEHNGFSHQNPGYVSNVIEKHGQFSSVYFPADANSLLVTLEDCFKRKNAINVIVSSKNPLPQWLTVEEAKKELKAGIGRWDWVDPKGSKNPDVVLAASGDEMVEENMAAVCILNREMPEMKLRFVNVGELTALGMGDERRPISSATKNFTYYFTEDKPVIYTFHGYKATIKSLLFGNKHAERFRIHGYEEEGTTTTPFQMTVLNKVSRYHVAMDALQLYAQRHPARKRKALAAVKRLEQKIQVHQRYIEKYGKDMPEITDWCWG